MFLFSPVSKKKACSHISCRNVPDGRFNVRLASKHNSRSNTARQFFFPHATITLAYTDTCCCCPARLTWSLDKEETPTTATEQGPRLLLPPLWLTAVQAPSTGRQQTGQPQFIKLAAQTSCFFFDDTNLLLGVQMVTSAPSREVLANSFNLFLPT